MQMDTPLSPPTFHKVTIRTAPDLRSDGTTVELDGLRLEGLVNVTFEHKCGIYPWVKLELFVREIDFDGVAQVLDTPPPPPAA
jgi:hypothetical protein